MVTFRKHTTIAEVLAVLRLHVLADVADRILMCRCGRWFNAPEEFSKHLLAEVESQLAAPQRPGAEITREVLAEVAEIHRSAPDGEKIRRVADFLGVSPRSAGTYVSRARKAGLLDAVAGRELTGAGCAT